MIKPVIITGGGGHARIVFDILKEQQLNIIGFTDISSNSSLSVDLPYLGQDNEILRYKPTDICLANGLGQVASSTFRQRVYKYFTSLGYQFTQVIHPSAIIASTAVIGRGVQIMAGAVIQPGVTIKENSIINTSASVDHDTLIGEHTHISPGVTICGSVTIGESVFIGAGATVVHQVEIGNHSVIGAGALLLHSLPENVTAYGVPAKEVT